MASKSTSRAVVVAAFTLAFLSPLTAGATPPLGQPNWTTAVYGSIDPNIAVGPNHVVITQNTMVYIHKKDGTLLRSKSTRDLFGWLWASSTSPNINDGLNLPAGASCDRTRPTDMMVGSQYNYCLNDWYDARVLYDEFRDRFVIVALARNLAAKCGLASDGMNPNPIYDARRSKLVVAYSGTADPNVDSWVYTVFDAVPGENCTTASCRAAWGYEFGDAADYPSIGLHRNYLLINVTHEGKPSECVNGDDDGYPDKTSTVHVYQADRLATGKTDSVTCMGLCSWVYHFDDLKHDNGFGYPQLETQVKGWLPVANIHGSSYLNHAWFALPVSGSLDKLNVWHFNAGGSTSRPTLHRSTATLPRFDEVDRDLIRDEYPQPVTSKTPNPANLTLTHTKSLVMQDEMLYYADVGGMSNGGPIADASIRLAGLIPSGSGSNVSFARGRNAIFHVDFEGYGSPAVEVDEDRTIVLTYSKFGVDPWNPTSLTGFGARYLTWTAGESTIPGGRALATNQDSMGHAECDDACRKFDTAGIGLGPGGRVYMMQPYVNSTPGWSYAVNYINP